MPVYEHSNIDFGKTQTHFSAIQTILFKKHNKNLIIR